MHFLEHKIPPPVVAVLCAALMWLLADSDWGWHWQLPETIKTGLSGSFIVLGFAFDTSGLTSFMKRHTSINPVHIEKASTLVTTGVYRISRNPMYLGLSCLLVAWALWLSSWLALCVVPLFMLFITRFQIMPEERLLAGMFGEEYAEYCARVRRWL